jgi:hypothetical protein
MDDTTLTIGGYPPEHALHPHPNLYFVRTADNLCSHTGAFIEFHDREHIRSECFELFVCGVDDRIGDNCTEPGKLMIDNPAIPAAVRTETARGEKMPVAGFTFRPNHVITLGYFSPESCN